MAYSSFKETIWSNQVQIELGKTMVFKDICNTRFQGEAKKGKHVKIIGVEKPTVKTYTPNTQINSAETPNDTSMDLNIDQYKYTNFLVDDIDAAQSNVDILKELMKGSAIALAEDADSYIASLVVDAKAENIMAPQEIATPTAAKKAIDSAFIKLWDEGVKTSGNAYIAVSPWFYALFKEALTESLTDNTDMVSKGILGIYNGAKVVMSNNIHKVGADDCIAVLTKDAIAYANGIDETNAYRPDGSFSDAVKILHTYGAKVVRPEQIVCLKVHPKA